MTSPVGTAFPNIQWDALGSLRLTAQETALLRMAETNPIDYTLADSRDASMYARVLLKLLAEAAGAGAGTGQCFQNKKNVVQVVHEENIICNFSNRINIIFMRYFSENCLNV